MEYDTWHVVAELGYTGLARRKNVALADLNDEKCIVLKNEKCARFPETFLHSLPFDSFLLSVPVLKVHSLAGVTLTMKNIMGGSPA